MICTRCGTQNPKDGKYCHECGKKLTLETFEAEMESSEQAIPNDTAVADALHEALKCYERGRIELAFVKCRHALRMKPDSASGHSLLALIYEKKADAQFEKGELDEAEDYLHAAIRQVERVMDSNPDSEADREKLDELIAKLESLSGNGAKKPGFFVRMPAFAQRVPKPVAAGVGSCAIVFVLLTLIFGRSKGVKPVSKDTERPQVAQASPEAQQPPIDPYNGAPQQSMPQAQPYSPPAQNTAPQAAYPQQPVPYAQVPQSNPPVQAIPPIAPYPIEPPKPIEPKLITPKPAPTPPRDPLEAARAAHRSKDFEAATRYYEQAIAAGRDTGEIEEKLGMCYYNLSKKAEALSHFQRAVQLYQAQRADGVDVAAADAAINRCSLFISALKDQ